MRYATSTILGPYTPPTADDEDSVVMNVARADAFLKSLDAAFWQGPHVAERVEFTWAMLQKVLNTSSVHSNLVLTVEDLLVYEKVLDQMITTDHLTDMEQAWSETLLFMARCYKDFPDLGAMPEDIRKDLDRSIKEMISHFCHAGMCRATTSLMVHAWYYASRGLAVRHDVTRLIPSTSTTTKWDLPILLDAILPLTMLVEDPELHAKALQHVLPRYQTITMMANGPEILETSLTILLSDVDKVQTPFLRRTVASCTWNRMMDWQPDDRDFFGSHALSEALLKDPPGWGHVFCTTLWKVMDVSEKTRTGLLQKMIGWSVYVVNTTPERKYGMKEFVSVVAQQVEAKLAALFERWVSPIFCDADLPSVPVQERLLRLYDRRLLERIGMTPQIVPSPLLEDEAPTTPSPKKKKPKRATTQQRRQARQEAQERAEMERHQARDEARTQTATSAVTRAMELAAVAWAAGDHADARARLGAAMRKHHVHCSSNVKAQCAALRTSWKSDAHDGKPARAEVVADEAAADPPSCPQPSPEEEDEDEFVCPITLQRMSDPVILCDGHTYERSAIEAWLRAHSTSPMTGECLTSTGVVPNRALAKVIQRSKEGP